MYQHGRPAAGVAGAIVIGGAALVAVASTDSMESTGAAPTNSASPATTSTGTTLTAETISEDQAVRIAAGQLATVGEVVVEEVDLEPEDGRMTWDVEFSGDHEVEIDAVTGAVLKLEIGDDETGDDRHRDDGDDHGDDEGDDRGDDHGGDREHGGSSGGCG